MAVTVNGGTYGIIKEEEDAFLLFDSHSRDKHGGPEKFRRGKGIVRRMSFRDLLPALEKACNKKLTDWREVSTTQIQRDDGTARELLLSGSRGKKFMKSLEEKLSMESRYKIVRSPMLNGRLREPRTAAFPRYNVWLQQLSVYEGVECDVVKAMVRKTKEMVLSFGNALYESICKRLSKRDNYHWKLMKAVSAISTLCSQQKES